MIRLSLSRWIAFSQPFGFFFLSTSIHSLLYTNCVYVAHFIENDRKKERAQSVVWEESKEKGKDLQITKRAIAIILLILQLPRFFLCVCCMLILRTFLCIEFFARRLLLSGSFGNIQLCIVIRKKVASNWLRKRNKKEMRQSRKHARSIHFLLIHSSYALPFYILVEHIFFYYCIKRFRKIRGHKINSLTF